MARPRPIPRPTPGPARQPAGRGARKSVHAVPADRLSSIVPLLAGWLVAVALAGCETLGLGPPATTAGPASTTASSASAPSAPESPAGVAPPRVNALIQTDQSKALSRPRIILGNNPQTPVLAESQNAGPEEGDISLNYVDADIREVVRAVLGNLLKVTYTIDPAVKGAVTVQTSQPVSRDALIPLLESVLAQNGAALVQRDGIYQVLPAAKATAMGLAPSEGGVGSMTELVPLRYTTAKDLARVLQPYIGEGVRLMPASGTNALLVTGTTAARLSLIALIRTFDVDFLAGQSYAIFPVKSDDPAKVANELERLAQTGTEGGGESAIRVIPLDRINAVLAIARQPAYLQRIGRYLDQVDEVGQRTARQLHIYYVQNGLASDLAVLLQKAFAPQAATTAEAQPPGLAPTVAPAAISSPTSGLGATGAPYQTGQTGGGFVPAGTQPQQGGTLGGQGLGQPQGQGQALGQQPPQVQTPGAESIPAAETQPQAEGTAPPKGIRIIPDKKNNALLIYATPEEYGLIEATLRKIDVLPLQVLVDTTIAEVTLNDALQYGTQWFFKSGKVSGIFSAAASGAVSSVFPGFNVLYTSTDASVVLSALEAVTKVKVISAPELVVLDNEKARLQVGDLVPIVTQQSQSTISANAPIVNSVQYQPTGVILDVAPRVNSGDLVTLDIAQEVSNVIQTTSSTINSPTISQRFFKTRVVVHDGETIGLGGLITDSTTISNSGLPWLTDIPVLGALFGTRNNTVARTELLVLLTPHVIHDQRDVRALTDELKQRLGRMAAEPTFHDPIEPPGPLRSQE